MGVTVDGDHGVETLPFDAVLSAIASKLEVSTQKEAIGQRYPHRHPNNRARTKFERGVTARAIVQFRSDTQADPGLYRMGRRREVQAHSSTDGCDASHQPSSAMAFSITPTSDAALG